MKNRLELINQLCDILYQNSDRLMQIAEDAGVHHTTLKYWLSGRTLFPRSDTLYKVATALGYDICLVKRKGIAKLRRAA